MNEIPNPTGVGIAKTMEESLERSRSSSQDTSMQNRAPPQLYSPFVCFTELRPEEETCQDRELMEKKPMGVMMRSKIAIETVIFSRYFYVHYDGSRLMCAKRTLSGFSIYSTRNGKLLGKMKANVFGTKYVLGSALEIKYETSFLDKGRPRSFKIRIEGLELMNKKPYFNTETNSFSLNFSGRVTRPSVKNFQVIHPLDPTYITLTFGKEEDDSYILDFAHPWSPLNAFCVGLSALDHKFGCD